MIWLFWTLATLIVASSFIAVTSGNLLRAAVSLMASFFCTAALFIFLKSEFIAVAHVLVYIGGIIIFIVFAILLTSHLGETHPKFPLFLRILSALLSAAVLTAFAWFFFVPQVYEKVSSQASHVPVTLRELGIRLLSPGVGGWLLPFELISVLLLAAMIGAIVIARKERKEG